MLVADSHNHCVRRVSADGQQVTTVAGVPGKGGHRDGAAGQAGEVRLAGGAAFENPRNARGLLRFAPRPEKMQVCLQAGARAWRIRSGRDRGDPGASGRAAIAARARAPAISHPARDRSINPARAAAPPLLI